MESINRLIRSSRDCRKRIAIVGDAMVDVWKHGKMTGCQDGCQCFRLEKTVTTPGGAGNAARQLDHWNVDCMLVAPVVENYSNDNHAGLICRRMPIKTRCVVGDRIVFREDSESEGSWVNTYGYGASEVEDCFRKIIGIIKNVDFDGVLIADYDKDILGWKEVQDIISICNKKGIPVVADGKRQPSTYRGSVLKVNEEYADKYSPVISTDGLAGVVVTMGDKPPQVRRCGNLKELPPVHCVNHVGAGDCFGAHLLLGLVHGLELKEAAEVAYSAGRVYVQRPYGIAVSPLQIRRDMGGTAGKVLLPEEVRMFGDIAEGKVVFTNGVFRIPHAGHAWLFNWARQQGDCLVVGINDDASAERLRPNETILPLEQRVEMIASMACVDWIVPFSGDDPCKVMEKLEPDYLVKGHEYAGMHVPGSNLAEVLIAPEDLYPQHTTDIVESIKGK